MFEISLEHPRPKHDVAQGSKAVDSRHFAFRASEGRETVDIGPQYID